MISLKVGDPICVGDTIQTGANSWVIFLLADNTQWMMAAKQHGVSHQLSFSIRRNRHAAAQPSTFW